MLEREEIDEAIRCQQWQRVRLSMKGTTTQAKLDTLLVYLNADLVCCVRRRRYVQVYNYLNALARGGQIEPLKSEKDLEEGKIVIRR